MTLALWLSMCSLVSAKILFVPLDSRPACKNFAVDAGRIAGLELIVPPHEMLDYFTVAGEPRLLRKWLNDNVGNADALIISIDQLLHGGLIAAREAQVSDSDMDSLIKFLVDLKKNNPAMPIYAFSILPRMQPQSTIENYYQRQALMHYSRLMGQMYAGHNISNEALVELNSVILPVNMQKYNEHFNKNYELNKKLMTLVEKGVLSKLILGCDDAEIFSLQSIEASRLLQNIKPNCELTHGADEIALTITAKIAAKDFQPKICVMYDKHTTKNQVLPYMASEIDIVVKEKIQQLNGKIVSTPTLADFTLFISVNDSDRESIISRKKAIETIEHLINDNRKVALVDLSMHFNKNETLLPMLLRKNVGINSLIAYAGWNTASNSIGTALAQAVIFCSSLNTSKMTLQVYTDNLTFLNQRFIEDQFYLKDVIDAVNNALKKSGSYDTSYLDLGTEYEFATFVMRSIMQKKINDYKQMKAFSKPVKINEAQYIEMHNLSVEVLRFPWQRTFEIDLKIKPNILLKN